MVNVRVGSKREKLRTSTRFRLFHRARQRRRAAVEPRSVASVRRSGRRRHAAGGDGAAADARLRQAAGFRQIPIPT